MTSSRLTRWVPSPRSAMRAALMALPAEMALRSMHGICTSPPIGSHVRPRLCSIAISAAFSTCCGVPPRISASPAGGHRRRGTYLALAADLGTGDGRALLVQRADRAGGQQKSNRGFVAVGVARRGVVHRVVQHGGDDSGGAVGRRGDDPPARCVLLVDGEGDEVHPVLGECGRAVRVLGVESQKPVTAPDAARAMPQAAVRHGKCPDARIPP